MRHFLVNIVAACLVVYKQAAWERAGETLLQQPVLCFIVLGLTQCEASEAVLHKQMGWRGDYQCSLLKLHMVKMRRYAWVQKEPEKNGMTYVLVGL